MRAARRRTGALPRAGRLGRRPGRHPGRALALLPALLALAGCGFRHARPLAPDRPSLGIELFSNDSFEPDIERNLHEAMSRAAQDYVDADLVRPSQADWVLRGRITSYRTRGGVRTFENELIEQGVYVEVEATFVDPETGEVLAGPLTRGTWVGYILDEIDARDRAADRSMANLAEGLLLELMVDSNPPPP